MKLIKKCHVALVAMLCSSAIYAACPSVSGYKLVSHSGHNMRCTYQAYRHTHNMHHPKMCMRSFYLTDYRYKLVSCGISHHSHRCVCTISRKHHH